MVRGRNQHTIATSCQVKGRGYWSGKSVSVLIHPAPCDHGVVLVRTDLPGNPSCPADVAYVGEAQMRTNVCNGAATFQMIEHLMAALTALEIDNCTVEINGEEMPGLDGSALAFVESLSAAGLILQAAAKPRLVIDGEYRIGGRGGWIQASPARAGESYFEYQLSFDDDTPIAPQAFSVNCTPASFIRGVASARTFVTEQQAAAIKSSGAASHVSHRDLIVIGSDGNPLEGEFRYENECARHKTLDLIGDLALSGFELVGRFTSFRGGHILNGRMAKQLAALARSETISYSRRIAA